MRGTWVYRDGQLVLKHLATRAPRGPRSAIPAPYLIRDQIDPLQSMLDGRLYESKSELRASYKAAGVREIGNDIDAAVKDAEVSRPSKPPVTIEDVAAAVQKVKQGYKPAPLETPAALDARDAEIGAWADDAA